MLSPPGLTSLFRLEERVALVGPPLGAIGTGNKAAVKDFVRVGQHHHRGSSRSGLVAAAASGRKTGEVGGCGVNSLAILAP
jgi:hypothetical protein